MSPTQRTLEWCRKRGWIAGVVERWIPQTRRRLDLFGFIDIVAVNGRVRWPYGIQTTSGANLASRIAKAKALETTEAVGKAFTLLFIGWRKLLVGKRRLWKPRVIQLVFLPHPGGFRWDEKEWDDVG
jgi:hypothetical protein